MSVVSKAVDTVMEAAPTTDALIAQIALAYPSYDTAAMRRAIPEAIDALYAVRGRDGTMHQGAAAAAIIAMIEWAASECPSCVVCPSCGDEVDTREATAL